MHLQFFFLWKVFTGVNNAEMLGQRICFSDPVWLQAQHKKKRRGWISQRWRLSIRPFPSFLQSLSYVSGWCRARQSSRCMLTRRPCRNPPEQRREYTRDRASRPQTPRRRRPKTWLLFWSETVLQWRQIQGSQYKICLTLRVTSGLQPRCNFPICLC